MRFHHSRLRKSLTLISIGLIAFSTLWLTSCSSKVSDTRTEASVPLQSVKLMVEFYHQSFDHYFITSDTKEIADLDLGIHPGWSRTGESFWVISPMSSVPNSHPVCRFYGLPEAGLDSHFFSASIVECNEVKQKFSGSWLLETDEAFRAFLPDQSTGQCGPGTVPVFRLWNNRVDSNHRYTTNINTAEEMRNKGYIPEGYGDPLQTGKPVAMCSPIPTGANITVSSGPLAGTYNNITEILNRALVIGHTSCITVNSCQAKTGFGPCTVISAPGYNEFQDPVCAHTPPPPPTPTPIPPTPTPAPTPVPPPPAGGGLCSSFSDIRYLDFTNISVYQPPFYTRDYFQFGSNTLIVVRVFVPAGFAPSLYPYGSISVAEYDGPPTFRSASLSTQPCDFRATDPTGANGPLVKTSGGSSISTQFFVGGTGSPQLTPGRTYYYNLRNYDQLIGPTCNQASCSAIISMSAPR